VLDRYGDDVGHMKRARCFFFFGCNAGITKALPFHACPTPNTSKSLGLCGLPTQSATTNISVFPERKTDGKPRPYSELFVENMLPMHHDDP
jgi:hypothetical protein